MYPKAKAMTQGLSLDEMHMMQKRAAEMQHGAMSAGRAPETAMGEMVLAQSQELLARLSDTAANMGRLADALVGSEPTGVCCEATPQPSGLLPMMLHRGQDALRAVSEIDDQMRRVRRALGL